MFGDADALRGIIQWVFFLAIIMFVFPKLYFYQIYAKLETSARKLEDTSKDGQTAVVKMTSKFGKNRKDLRKILTRFIDFFMIPPVNLDPFGIVKKLDHMIKDTEYRFKQVAWDMAPKADSERGMDVYMGLQAAWSIHMIAKIVRHYVELVKKFKNLQIAMIIQMQLPLIEKLVEAERRGLDAFLHQKPVGDAIGPLMIASMVKGEGKEIAPEVVSVTDNRWGRKITLLKAMGPGGRLGQIGEAVKKTCDRNKISKIITIDAAAKLEGEKTGSVAEGVGAAIGGMGVQRSKIEETAVEKKILMEAIAIKMSQFEAISPMPKEVVDAMDTVKDMLKERIEDTEKDAHILVVGVGNTCGVPNTNKSLRKVIDSVKKEAKRIKDEEDAKNKGFFKKKKKEKVDANIAQLLWGVGSPVQGFGNSAGSFDIFKNYEEHIGRTFGFKS